VLQSGTNKLGRRTQFAIAVAVVAGNKLKFNYTQLKSVVKNSTTFVTSFFNINVIKKKLDVPSVSEWVSLQVCEHCSKLEPVVWGPK
jgi:hypothetical protein